VHRWVLENIEQEDGKLFASAPAMVASRSGNRTRVLHYLLSLLEVPCEYALARSLDRDATDGPVSDDDTYNALLIRVRTEKGERWVTTANRSAPSDWFPSGLSGQTAIMIAAGAPHVTLPAADLSAHARVRTVHVKLDAEGDAQVEVTERMRGSWAIILRDRLRQIDEANMKQEFEEYVGGSVTGASLKDFKIEGMADRTQDVTLHYTFDVSGLAVRQGNTWVFGGMFAAEMSGGYAALRQRTVPTYNLDVVDETLDLTLDLPNGWRVQDVPAPAQGEATGVKWSMAITSAPHGVHIARHLAMPPGRLNPQQYVDFARQVRAFDHADQQQLEIVGQ